MNVAHFHLISVHLPLVALPICLILWFAGRRLAQPVLVTAGLIGILLSGLSTLPPYLSGEPAEEIVEHIKGVKERQIEKHEDAAGLALGLGLAASVLALGTLLARHKDNKLAPSLELITAFVTLAGVAAVSWTGYQGGMIGIVRFQAHSSRQARGTSGVTAPALDC